MDDAAGVVQDAALVSALPPNGGVFAVGMLQSDIHAGDAGDVVSSSHIHDKIAVGAIRGQHATLHRRTNGACLHDIGDVEVGDLDATRRGGLHCNGDVHGPIAVVGHGIVEG